MVWANKGTTHRPIAVGTRGVVASAHQLASLAGMRMLIQGGNAVDAAVAIAAALNVAEPYMSGMGGAGYLMHVDGADGAVSVLDYMGSAPRAASTDAFANRAEQEHGPKSPLIPTALAGWLTALEAKGRLDRAAVFAPAIEYAEHGVPLTTINATFFARCLAAGHMDSGARAVFGAHGATPGAGTIVRQPLLAETFRRVVAGGQEAFYRGPIARDIVEAVQAAGGLLSLEDMAGVRPEWQDSLSISYRGYGVHTAKPPCSGIQYLQTLKLLERYDIAALGHNTAETLHLFLEAAKIAVADRIHYSALGPDCPTTELLDPEYLANRAALIDPTTVGFSEGERFDGRLDDPRAIPPGSLRTRHKLPESTTHFDVIDADGNAVAVTQSLGDGFGSGFMAGATGLMLNNFNYWFDSDPTSPNAIGPNKRIEMCMSPAVLTHGNGDLFGVIGTPGSFGILQTTPQMIMNVLDHGFSIQAAIEAPRVRAYEATTIEVESRIPVRVRDALSKLGHDIRLLDDWSFLVGGGQGALIDPDTGARYGGADPRRDGAALGY